MDIKITNEHLKEFGEISLKEDFTEEFLPSEASSFDNVDGMCVKSDNTLPNTSTVLLKRNFIQENERFYEILMKEEIKGEPLEDAIPLLSREELKSLEVNPSPDSTKEITLQSCLQEDEFGEISFKEEFTEEFLPSEASSFDNVDGLCVKSENTLPNTSSVLLKRNFIQENERFYEILMKEEIKEEPLEDAIPLFSREELDSLEVNPSPQSPKKITLQSCLQEDMILPSQAFDNESNWISDVYPRSECPEKGLENIPTPDKSTQTNINNLHHSIVNKKIYECYHCPYQTTEMVNFNRHLRNHTGYKLFKCTLCCYQTVTKARLKIHSFIHSSVKPFKCSLCTYEAESNDDLRKHSCNSWKKPFKCSLCSYQTARKAHLRIHSYTHSGEKPFKCSLCSYKTARKADLRKHSYTHGEKPHKCSLCSYQTANKTNLKNHSYTHGGEKPHECSICSYKTAIKADLRNHLYTHSGEKPHKCNLCSYSAKTKAYLRKHLYTHSGEKPHKCSLCSYQTKTKDYLRKHLYTHSGEKPHKCSLCSYQTKNKADLRKHSYTHSGEKPHKCNICSYQTSKKAYLKKHLYIHSGGKSSM